MIFFVNEYLEGKCYPFCITPILKVFIQFIKSSEKLDPFYVQIYTDTIIHLHSSHQFVTFYPLLTEIIDIFSSQDPSICLPIFRKVIKYWPKSQPSKQVLFINLLIFILERITSNDFSEIIVPLFTLFAKVATEKYAKAADASMQIWNNVYIIPKLIDHSSTIYPIVYSAYTRTMNEHWNAKTRNVAHSTLKKMHDNDQFVYDNMSSIISKTIDQDVRNSTIKHKNWATIARCAAKVDKSVNLVKVLGDIQINFNLDILNENVSTSNKHKKNFREPSGSKNTLGTIMKAKRHSQIVAPFHNTWKL